MVVCLVGHSGFRFRPGTQRTGLPGKVLSFVLWDQQVFLFLTLVPGKDIQKYTLKIVQFYQCFMGLIKYDLSTVVYRDKYHMK